MSRSERRLADARRQAARRQKIQPSSALPVKLTISNSQRDAITRSNPLLLLAIESTLVSAHESEPDIDDRMVRDVLEALIRTSRPTDAVEAALYDALSMMRSDQFEVSDDTWHGALRVIRDSVRTNSSCKPGDVSYLKYAKRFVETSNR